MRIDGSTLVVTGAAGLIGSTTTDLLLRQYEPARAIRSCGVTPVVVDIDFARLSIDPALVTAALRTARRRTAGAPVRRSPLPGWSPTRHALRYRLVGGALAGRPGLAVRYHECLHGIPGVVLADERSAARTRWPSVTIGLEPPPDQRAVMQRMPANGVATRRGLASLAPAVAAEGA
jgi:hypothetical protein